MTRCTVLYRTKARKGHLMAFPISDGWWPGLKWLLCLLFPPSSLQLMLPPHWLGTSLHLCSQSLPSLLQEECVLPALAPSHEETELSAAAPSWRFAHETNYQSPLASDKNDITSTVSAADSESSTQLSISAICFCPIWFCWRIKPGSILWCTPKEPSMVRICLWVLNP